MASSRAPEIMIYKADAAISKGMAVKFGSDFKHVAKGAAQTDHVMGICQNDPTTAEDAVEVAMSGAGAKGLLGETVAAGDFLASHTDGSLRKTTGAGSIAIAQAMQDGVLGDLIDVNVISPTPASGANA